MTQGDILLILLTFIIAYALFGLGWALLAAVLAWPLALAVWFVAAAVFPRSEP